MREQERKDGVIELLNALNMEKEELKQSNRNAIASLQQLKTVSHVILSSVDEQTIVHLEREMKRGTTWPSVVDVSHAFERIKESRARIDDMKDSLNNLNIPSTIINA